MYFRFMYSMNINGVGNHVWALGMGWDGIHRVRAIQEPACRIGFGKRQLYE